MEPLYKYRTSERIDEFANLSKGGTGLPMVVWISANMNMQHNVPRLKFQNSYSDKMDASCLIPMSIEDNPKILLKNKSKVVFSSSEIEKLSKWIRKNKSVLLDYWNMNLAINECLPKLQKI